MKVRYLGPNDPLVLLHGKVYDVVCLAKDINWYVIKDETGGLYLYNPASFEIAEGGIEDLPKHTGPDRKMNDWVGEDEEM